MNARRCKLGVPAGLVLAKIPYDCPGGSSCYSPMILSTCNALTACRQGRISLAEAVLVVPHWVWRRLGLTSSFISSCFLPGGYFPDDDSR
jgi:hypothetical protein